MNNQFDQVISLKIDEILMNAQLSLEMMQMIHSSLNADSKTGEMFKWAHLTLLSCECVGGVYEAALPGAIAMELFALAADIFDDVQDQDNNCLPWRKLSNAKAINLATCLLMLGYETISIIPDNSLFRRVNTILNRTGISASDGQFIDFIYDNNEIITFEQYFSMVKRKSGSLTACACKIGAILGGASEALVLQFDQFGTNFGIMSQIRNDLNDFLNFETKKDFISNRKTLPYVYLLSVLKGEAADQFKELTQIVSKGDCRFGDKEQDDLKQITMDEGVVHYCTVMYEMFRQKSMGIIKAIPVPEKRKEKMIELVEEMV